MLLSGILSRSVCRVL